MKLYQSPTSPYVRIVRAAALEKGLDGKIELVAAREPGAGLDRLNPLDKIPTLVTDDGETLIESRLICQYLDAFGEPKLYPHDPAARRKVLQQEAVIQGIMDAVVLRRMETRRDDSEQSLWWIERQMRKIERGLAKIEGEIDDFTCGETIVPIALCCALDFMDRLKPHVPEFDWRPAHPKLAAWHEGYSERPAMAATRPAEG